MKALLLLIMTCTLNAYATELTPCWNGIAQLAPDLASTENNIACLNELAKNAIGGLCSSDQLNLVPKFQRYLELKAEHETLLAKHKASKTKTDMRYAAALL